MPSGGTSDYAPEMIHAAARGEPYDCFVRPDTTIPFMAMPDGVDALLTLAAAPRERLTRTAYNLTAFNPSAAEIRDVVVAAFPDATIGYKVDAKRQGIVDSWPAAVDDSAARADWGFAPKYDFERAFQRIPDPDDSRALPETIATETRDTELTIRRCGLRAGHAMAEPTAMTNRLNPVRLVIAIGSAIDAASRRTVESDVR